MNRQKDIFRSEHWKEVYRGADLPTGLRVRFETGIHPFVRTSVIYLTRWLREEYAFPVRLNVYCKRGEKVRCRDGSLAYAVMFQPDDRHFLPSIRLGCGKFSPDDPAGDELMNTTDLIMLSLTHEIVHYFQYINDSLLSQRGAEWQATNYSTKIMNRYLDLCEEEE